MTSAAESLFGADLVAAMRATGLRASAYAAIWMHGRWSACCRSPRCDRTPRRELAGRLPGIESSAGSRGRARCSGDGVHRPRGGPPAHRDAIARTAFHTVVQPVVDLATEEIRGYEALTRFDDGRAPDVWFAEAHEAGMGVVLEEACARLAIASARDLPAELALGINLSPSTIRESSVLEALAGAGRPVVIEVTEHAPVDDYDAIRESVAAVPDLGLAVDDAGAGFASLRHILELRPAWVKIDMGLVRDIHRDPARAAIVAGMVHFARLTGTRLVAEGVEVRAEADTLAGLGVELAQGFLFGRPAPP
jgi:EAL domain-containing protein (putative c-di-GMP-specific phosphodiesterase class I)